MTQHDLPLRKLLTTLFPRVERWRLGVVLLVTVVTAMFEVAGVASILPFMAIVMDPGAVDRYTALRKICEFAGATTASERLVVLGILTSVIIVANNAAAAIGVWVQQRFVARTKIRISTALFDGYLAQPYSFHVRRDAPSLLNVIYNDAELAVRLVSGSLQFVARSLVIIALLALLVLQNPVVATWTLAVLGGCYFLIYQLVRRWQERLGSILQTSSVERARTAQEGFGGIKDLIVLGRERAFSERFRVSTRDVSIAHAKNLLSSLLPRYLLEPIAFSGILAVALVLLVTKGMTATAVIPTLTLYAFVGYRLLPALQALYYAAVEVRFTLPALRNLHGDWVETQRADSVDFRSPEIEPIAFPDTTIQLEHVSFRYEGAARLALSDISFTLAPGKSVGLVGRTGSGKTTLADILLGLYEPGQGRVTVGRIPLEGAATKAWHKHVGYVPQQVFLSNASIAENIAFGIPANQLDRRAVELAASLAQASDFIAALPEGLDTIVGERGVKLSGGQRQRLGIARALYQRPEILVFDEATSALDGMTEDAVMDAIHALSGQRTVILIAHRIRTVEACDRIIMLEDGKIVADGPYTTLMESSQKFRQLNAPSVSADTIPMSKHPSHAAHAS